MRSKEALSRKGDAVLSTSYRGGKDEAAQEVLHAQWVQEQRGAVEPKNVGLEHVGPAQRSAAQIRFGHGSLLGRACTCLGWSSQVWEGAQWEAALHVPFKYACSLHDHWQYG